MWDITQELDRAVKANSQFVTLIIDTQRLRKCARDPLRGTGCEQADQIGFLRFASKEANFGLTIAPRISVVLSESPTLLKQTGAFLVGLVSLLATLAGLYTAVRSFRK